MTQDENRMHTNNFLAWSLVLGLYVGAFALTLSAVVALFKAF